ncbi:hypothetical protein PPACK8108_LOCUS19331 [Phakopsora pachyrhizi]|uniref:Uncharacterized protein n=1 Tax=Phakopsora pachyrhizi TaxID=170000 RepID=A0AAV0BEG6_PHAPC|nr:hypothetical protein PPACK8108_LOCUS19331 [Phakopsora pachyrhizi]
MDDRIDIDQDNSLSCKKRINEKDISFDRVYYFGFNSHLARVLEEGDHNLDLESSKQNPDVKPKQIDDGTKELEQPLKNRCELAESTQI